MKDKSITPEFRQAMNAYLLLVEQVGPDHPQAQQAFHIAMHHAPEWLLDKISDVAMEKLLLKLSAIDLSALEFDL